MLYNTPIIGSSQLAASCPGLADLTTRPMPHRLRRSILIAVLVPKLNLSCPLSIRSSRLLSSLPSILFFPIPTWSMPMFERCLNTS
jgi:hypothetical protein